MPRWLKITGTILVVLLIAGSGAYYWYIGDGNPPAGIEPFDFDLAAVRAKADELPGGKATEIRVERIGSFSFPAVAVIGGEGWNIVPIVIYSYQVILPADTLIIDSALPPEMAASMGAEVDPTAYSRMETAMTSATQIVVTHEHSDHVGGVVSHSEPAAIQKALRLNKEQVESLPRYGLSLPTALSDYAAIDYSGSLAIAPGIVLIRAPGHTPGSQMVYVKREDGREFLFIGDIGWTHRNVETGKSRPRLLSDLILHEDRDAVFEELAMLKALHAAEPDLVIVPGHDVTVVDALLASGDMQAQFMP